MKKYILRSARGAMRETGKRFLKSVGIKYKGRIKPLRSAQRLPPNQILKYDVNVTIDKENLKRYGKKVWKKGGREFALATGASVAGAGIYANLSKKTPCYKKFKVDPRDSRSKRMEKLRKFNQCKRAKV